MDTIKLISVNIEGNKHLEKVISFLRKEDADIVCLQEAITDSIELLKINTYQYHFYAPMETIYVSSKTPSMGLLILSKYKLQEQTAIYYAGNADDLPVMTEDATKANRVVIFVSVIKNTALFHVATTHFTWSLEGKTSIQQQEHFMRLKEILQNKPDLILCGDFNAPRGREIFNELSTMYADNIPTNIASTLDPILHRTKGLELVVDGLFTSPQYRVENIQIAEGVSDHRAIVAQIVKINL